MDRAKWWLLAGAGMLTVCAVLKVVADEPAPPQAPSVAEQMQAKLASSQKILRGLVTEDFALIRSGANELRDIDAIAEHGLQRDQVYEHYSAEFRRLSEKLMRMAEHQNLEGASFVYMHVTSTCINCHEYVRDVTALPQLPKDPHVKRAGGVSSGN